MDKDTFYGDVYKLVRLIPEGRVSTYGAIAKGLGYPSHARRVGMALNDSKILENIPAHRVVNSTGRLTGRQHFGEDRMQKLLEREGLKIKNDRVSNFKEKFWDPLEEI